MCHVWDFDQHATAYFLFIFAFGRFACVFLLICSPAWKGPAGRFVGSASLHLLYIGARKKPEDCIVVVLKRYVVYRIYDFTVHFTQLLT